MVFNAKKVGRTEEGNTSFAQFQSTLNEKALVQMVLKMACGRGEIIFYVRKKRRRI